MIYRIIFSLTCITFFSSLFSQDTLKSDNIYIVKGFKPEIAKSNKLPEIPKTIETNVKPIAVEYSFINKQLENRFDIDPIKPAKMKGEPLDKLYNHYVKAGLGNNLSTLLDVNINSKRSRKYMYGVTLNHLGSAGKVKNVAYSGFTQNNFNAFGKQFLAKQMLYADFNYSWDFYHYYGIENTNVNLPQIANFKDYKKANQQWFNKPSLKLGYQSFNKDSSDLNYTVELSYYNLTDHYYKFENRAILNSSFEKLYGKEFIKLDASVDVNLFRNGLFDVYSDNSVLFRLHPQIISKGKKWHLNAGLAVFLDAETDAKFYFKPVAEFKYNLIKNIIIPYVGIDGAIQRNTFDSFRQSNQFLSNHFEMNNSNQKNKVYGGIRGAYSSKISFNVGAFYQKVEQFAFFQTDTTQNALLNTFTIAYDTMQQTGFLAEVSYQQTEKLKLLLKGEYNIYEMKNEQKAWYLPAYKGTLSAFYDLKDKIIIKSDIFLISDFYGKNYTAPAGKVTVNGIYAEKLPLAVDVNLGAEYRYTNRLSAFLNFNNVAGLKYYRYFNYPLQRFQVLGGLTYRF